MKTGERSAAGRRQRGVDGMAGRSALAFSGVHSRMMPTLLCVPIMVDDADAALADARGARDHGADLVEYRIDRVFHGGDDTDGIRVASRLVDESPLPCIVTCRAAAEGGEFDGDDAGRVALWEHLGAGSGGLLGPIHAPRYIDVELATYARSANLRQKVNLAADHPGQVRDGVSSLILSAHDFSTRPAKLASILAEMRRHDAARIHKVAWRARSLRDNLEAFEVLRERDRPTIALCMGEFGLMSRVLAPKFGGFLTFASLRDSSATAPGQPTIRELVDLYRFRSIGPKTRVYGVMGWPVAHSRSPHVHNAAFEAAGHDGVYLPLPIPTEWEHFKATVMSMLDFGPLEFRGASVTIPHKEHLARLAREDGTRRWSADAIVERAGAANTLVVSEGGACRVMNTDAGAAAQLIERAVGRALDELRIAVLGAGGVARGIAAALVERGATVVIYNRTRERAEQLADALMSGAPAPGKIVAGPWEKRCAGCADVIVNCTSIGMSGGPDPNGSPISREEFERFGEKTIIFETVYTPRITPLLAVAQARGLPTIDGAEMFLGQAALQFEAWTGSPAPRTLMKAVLDESFPSAQA